MLIGTHTHTCDTHASLKMDTLDIRCKKHVAVQIFKFLNCDGLSACRSMFTLVSDYHDIYTRSSQRCELVIPNLNLAMAQRNIHYFGTKIWKSIPVEIKVSPNFHAYSF